MAAADDELLRRPIIIIGAPRSGTSLLLDILGSHSRLAAFAEPRITWRYGNDRGSDLLRPEDARPEVRRHIRETFAHEIRALGRTRFVEKTPSNALRPGFVERVFPDCLFLNILRDGREAVLSIRDAWKRRARGLRGYRPNRWRSRFRELDLRRTPVYAVELLRRALPESFAPLTGHALWGPRLPGMQGLLRDLDLLEVCCLQWRMCVELGGRHGRRLPADRYLEVRLEDFSAEALRRVLDFCGLEDDPQLWARFEKDFDPAHAGTRMASADPAELETILDWIEPTMRWLGYEV